MDEMANGVDQIMNGSKISTKLEALKLEDGAGDIKS